MWANAVHPVRDVGLCSSFLFWATPLTSRIGIQTREVLDTAFGN